MLKKTLIIGLALIGALWVSEASAQKNKCPQTQNKAQHHKMGIPDLSEDQAEKIDALRIEHQKIMFEYKTELAEKEAQYISLTTGENIDVDAAKAVLKEIAAIKLQMAQAKLDHRMAVRKLLTEEQQLWYDQHFAMGKKHSKHGSHSGSGMFGGHGNGSGDGTGNGKPGGNGQGMHDGTGPHGTGHKNNNANCPHKTE